MSRRHTDPVEVRTQVSPHGPVPEQFLWRDRLYVVREVLSCWTQSGSWWKGTAIRSLTSGEGATAVLDDRETTWWRVEADSGRLAALTAGPGVYDLCFAPSTGSWSLRRVLD